MEAMLDSGKVTRGGQCIDLYNQAVYDGVFVTITTRVDECNHYWVSQRLERLLMSGKVPFRGGGVFGLL